MNRRTVAVIGAGTWGISLAAAATRAGAATMIFSRRELGKLLPKGVTQASTMSEVGEKARLIVLTVPSTSARVVARQLGAHVDGRHLVIHGVRGLDETMKSISDLVREETPVRRLGAIGGPVLPDELTAGKPSVMVSGSPFPDVNEAVAEAFASDRLQVFGTRDLIGLEWSSALVGCLAILVGYAQQAGMAPGLVAAVITRAVAEASLIVQAAGGDGQTMFGLGGYGDLLASITQPERPETVLGRALARGKSLEGAISEARLRVEAIELIPRILKWADSHRVATPILAALSRGLFQSPAPDHVIAEVMSVPARNA